MTTNIPTWQQQSNISDLSVNVGDGKPGDLRSFIINYINFNHAVSDHRKSNPETFILSCR